MFALHKRLVTHCVLPWELLRYSHMVASQQCCAESTQILLTMCWNVNLLVNCATSLSYLSVVPKT